MEGTDVVVCNSDTLLVWGI